MKTSVFDLFFHVFVFNDYYNTVLYEKGCIIGYMTRFTQCQNKTEWDNYIFDNGGHPLQLWGWGDVKAAHGWLAYRLFTYNDNEELIGAIQVLIKKLPWPFKSLAYVPRGPVVSIENRDELLSGIGDYIKSNFHSVAITIEPDEEKFRTKTNWTISENNILPKRTIILDLNKSESDLLSAMAKKTRQYIRKSAAEDIKIKMVRNSTELEKCLDIYEQTAKRADFGLHDRQYYYDVFDRLGECSPVFAVYSGDQPIAFLWLAISANTAYELYGGMNELGQQLRANYMLKWHAIKKCKEWGLSRYDFGGLIDGGITTFKKGWAGEATELAGTFDCQLSIFYGVWTRWLPVAKKIIRKIRSIFKRK